MALTAAQIEAQIASNATSIAGYQAALEADSANPLKTYSKDGESLSRNEWRAGLIAAVKELVELNAELQGMLNRVQPYILRTRHAL